MVSIVCEPQRGAAEGTGRDRTGSVLSQVDHLGVDRKVATVSRGGGSEGAVRELLRRHLGRDAEYVPCNPFN